MPCERNRRRRLGELDGVGGDRAALAGRDRLHRVEREHAHVGVVRSCRPDRRASSAPSACAASSMTTRGRCDERRRGRPAARRSAPRPSASQSADVAEVEVERLRDRCRRTRAGRRPRARSSRWPTNDSGDVATVSPVPMPAAHSAACSADRAVGERHGVRGAGGRAQRASNSLDGRALRQPVAAQHLHDRGDVVVVDRLAAVGDHLAARGETERRSSIESHSSLVSLAYTKSSSSGLPTALGPHLVPPRVLGHHDVHLAGVDRVAGLVGGDQQLVQLLARPDADHLAGRAGRHRLGEVGRPASTGSSG